MKKVLMMAVGLVSLLQASEGAAAAAGGDDRTASGAAMLQIKNMEDLLQYIKNLPEIKNFLESDFEQKALGSKVDRYTLTSILNLQKGREPVGFGQYGEAYAKDADNLGYKKIAQAFRAWQSMYFFERWNLSDKNRVESVKATVEKAEEALKQAIEGMARTLGDVDKVKAMSLDEARRWFVQEYQKRVEKFNSEKAAHEQLIAALQQ